MESGSGCTSLDVEYDSLPLAYDVITCVLRFVDIKSLLHLSLCNRALHGVCCAVLPLPSVSDLKVFHLTHVVFADERQITRRLLFDTLDGCWVLGGCVQVNMCALSRMYCTAFHIYTRSHSPLQRERLFCALVLALNTHSSAVNKHTNRLNSWLENALHLTLGSDQLRSAIQKSFGAMVRDGLSNPFVLSELNAWFDDFLPPKGRIWSKVVFPRSWLLMKSQEQIVMLWESKEEVDGLVGKPPDVENGWSDNLAMDIGLCRWYLVSMRFGEHA
jgi:hypothetical protein